MATLLVSTNLVPQNASSFRMKNSIRNHRIITSKHSFPIFHAPKKSLLSTVFKSLDNFICDFIDSSLHPALDAARLLSRPGNFTPVEELPPTACEAVEGVLPSCLHGGAYIRIGPNPQFIPKGPYHMFDGDGMLQMITISHAGKPTFCCRYVKTHKYTVEREMGYPFVPSIFSSFNGGLLASAFRTLVTALRILAGHFDPLNHGFGTANTNLALFSGQLFALCESDLPYAVKVTAEGDIITLGRHDFGATEPFSRMTAHLKVDRATGEAFAYAYDVTTPPLNFFRINSEGRKKKSVPIPSLKKLTFIHDFAVTENYAVIPEGQIVVNPMSILRGRSPVEIDPEKVSRLGIIPRYAEDGEEMVWIEAAGFNPLHCVNAWEEDGGATVCMVASNALAVDQLLEKIGCAELRLELITVSLREKTVKRRPLSAQFLDFGIINPAFAAKKNRYIYATLVCETRISGVVKLDLSVNGDCTVAIRQYGAGCHGGEAFFVARDANNPAAEEDDGYLVTYLHDNNTQESKFLVMDAKSPNLDIIAAVKLPQRIPDGFHSLFLLENELNHLINSS